MEVAETDPIEEFSSPRTVVEDPSTPQIVQDLSKPTELENASTNSIASPLPSLPVESQQILSTDKSGYLASSEPEITQEPKLPPIPAAQLPTDSSASAAFLDSSQQVDIEPKPFTSPEQAQGVTQSTFELSSSVPQPPPFPESLGTQSFLEKVRTAMPDTRRSLKGGAAPAPSVGATDETESPVRKSLRGMRNDAALKRTEAKVKAQKLAEERKKNGTESKIQRRSASVPGSETTGSSAATIARGRGRKFQHLTRDAEGNSRLLMPSNILEDEDSSTKATNGEGRAVFGL